MRTRIANFLYWYGLMLFYFKHILQGYLIEVGHHTDTFMMNWLNQEEHGRIWHMGPLSNEITTKLYAYRMGFIVGSWCIKISHVAPTISLVPHGWFCCITTHVKQPVKQPATSSWTLPMFQFIYRKVSNIRRTKSQNLSVSRLLL